MKERFGGGSEQGARENLKNWAKSHEIDVQWAYPKSVAWNIKAPPKWREDIEIKLGRRKPPTRGG